MASEREKYFIFWSQCPDNHKQLKKLLKEDGWQSFVAVDRASLKEFFSFDEKKLCCLAVLSNQQLTVDDIELILRFLKTGNSLLVAQDGSYVHKQLLNKLLKDFGVKFKSNDYSVIRPNPYKFYHPKEAQLEDFVANDGLLKVIRKYIEREKIEPSDVGAVDSFMTTSSMSDGLRMLYPKGCTLEVDTKLATIMMTSSRFALPSEKPICAFFRDDKTVDNCRIVVLGSASFFNDQYLNLEHNKPIARSLLDYIVDKEFQINLSDAKTVEISAENMTADLNTLIDVPIHCIREPETLPDDKMQLVDKKLFTVDQSMLMKITKAYRRFHVPAGRLTLIKPKLSLNPFALEPANHGYLLKKLDN